MRLVAVAALAAPAPQNRKTMQAKTDDKSRERTACMCIARISHSVSLRMVWTKGRPGLLVIVLKICIVVSLLAHEITDEPKMQGVRKREPLE